jgi:hypothetical protein
MVHGTAVPVPADVAAVGSFQPDLDPEELPGGTFGDRKDVFRGSGSEGAGKRGEGGHQVGGLMDGVGSPGGAGPADFKVARWSLKWQQKRMKIDR